MNTRFVLGVVIATLLSSVIVASAQTPEPTSTIAARYLDPASGISLEQAITRALAQEPSLAAARSEIDVARGMRLQAELRPNPSVSFERRQEPAGTDDLTTVAVEWPLDLFRRGGRIAVAERAVAATALGVANRERLLAADVRMRYGDVLMAVREVTTLDELVEATRRQHELLRSRVQEGAAPPLERDLLDVELRRLESDRLLQVGRTEAALFELKRVLGMPAAARLVLRDTLDDVVKGESSLTAVDLSMDPAKRADVREAEARLSAAEATIDRARREGRFDVSLFGSYMRMDAGFPQRAFAADGSLERVRGQFNYIAAGAMVTVPLQSRNQGEVAAARAGRAGAAAAYDALRLTAQTEVAAARTRDEHAQQAVRIYSTGAQTLARQNLSVVAQSYELGRVTVFDVLAERRRYLDVERAYTDALRAAYEARTALKRALGDVQ
ncbi:MAG: TolC family protein [Vicinamibacterales bacterium]